MAYLPKAKVIRFQVRPSADCVEVTMFIVTTWAGKRQVKAGRG
jgi:hypothetical protein